MSKTLAITEACPMELGLNILSGKWTLRILWHLSKTPVRFNELQRRLSPITTKALTQQLRALEEEGMVTRTVCPSSPPQVEYRLSDLGQTILPVLQTLCDWGKTYQEARTGDGKAVPWSMKPTGQS